MVIIENLAMADLTNYENDIKHAGWNATMTVQGENRYKMTAAKDKAL
jgi:hypothetical protein